jgi:hypothetical protein
MGLLLLEAPKLLLRLRLRLMMAGGRRGEGREGGKEGSGRERGRKEGVEERYRVLDRSCLTRNLETS